MTKLLTLLSVYFTVRISKQTKPTKEKFVLSYVPSAQFPPSAETSGSLLDLVLRVHPIHMKIKKSGGGEIIRVRELWLLTCAWDVLATLLTSALLSSSPEHFQLSACGKKNRGANHSYSEAVDGDEEKTDSGFGDTEEDLSSEDGGAGNNSNGKSNNSSKADGGEEGKEGEANEEDDDTNNRNDNDDDEVDGDDNKDDSEDEDNEDEDEGENKDEEEIDDKEEVDDEDDEDDEEEDLQPPKRKK